MQTVPQVQPITNMQKAYNKVVDMLANGPVFLTRQSETAAVLVDPDEWNRIATELHHLRGLAEARANSARADRDDSWVSLAEMDEAMAPYVGD